MLKNTIILVKASEKKTIQAKGKLIDKIKNLRYQSPDKVYIRKRRNTSVIEETAKKSRESSEGI